MTGTKRQRDIKPDVPRKKAKCETTSNANRRATRSMTTDASRRAVFQTAELLECIILFLPPRNIFGSQRVCRQSQDVITQSTKIQEKLFVRVPSHEAQAWVMKPATYLDYRSAYKLVRVKHLTEIRKGDKVVTAVEPNIILYEEKLVVSKYSAEIFVAIPEVSSIRSVQSWHNMHLAQPPVKRASLELHWKITADVFGSVRREVSNDNGVTFGQLVHAALFQQTKSDDEFCYDDSDENFEIAHRNLSDLLDLLEQKHGQKARLSRSPDIILEDVVDYATAEAKEMK